MRQQIDLRMRSARSTPSSTPWLSCVEASALTLTPTSGRTVVSMELSEPPRQLRLIIETDDFDSALHFYRDVLGMPEQPAFATQGDDRVAILHAGTATIELATPTHVRAIDAIENVPASDSVPTLRLALEISDTSEAVAASEASGASVIAPPTETPFRTINARVQGPAGWQITFFQELETLKVRATRKGFATDAARPR